MKKYKIAVAGTGYVGLSIILVFHIHYYMIIDIRRIKAQMIY